MADFELFSSELMKPTKIALIEIILNKAIPESVKLSQNLSAFLNLNESLDNSCTNTLSSIATIFESVSAELKFLSINNANIHNLLKVQSPLKWVTLLQLSLRLCFCGHGLLLLAELNLTITIIPLMPM